tara:strand:- start:26331 stop:27023 length:693 start_codon:yes stop_codon:yes gene_type:complete
MIANPQNVKASWKPFFESQKDNLIEINAYLGELQKEAICPSPANIFKAFEMTELHDFSVLLLSQDPYINGEACGLAFSIADGHKISPSLRNIFAEINHSMGVDNRVSDGDLSSWTDRVLLLNTSLTTERGRAGAHRKVWKRFASDLIDFIAANRQDFVMLAWGTHAHKVSERLEGVKVIKTSHPSPLGYTKHGKDFTAFKGSNCFNVVNDMLLSIGHAPCSWKLNSKANV